MAATFEQIIAKSRELHAAGDIEGATRLARIAVARRNQAATESAADPAPKSPTSVIQSALPNAAFAENNTHLLAPGIEPANPVQTSSALQAGLLGLNQGATFGFGDEIAAGVQSALGGQSYDAALAGNREALAQSRDERPWLTGGAEVAGSMLVPVPGAAMRAMGTGSTMSRIGAGAVTGAGLGGAYGFGTGEGGAVDRLRSAGGGALVGGGFGVAASALGQLFQGAIRGRAERAAVRDAAKTAPSAEELRRMGQSLYQQVDDAGVQIRPEAFDRMRGGLRDNLRASTGFDELPGPGSLTPNSARAMRIMDEAGERMAQEPTAALPFRSLDQMRRQAGAAAGNVTNKSDQAAGMRIIEGLDDFIEQVGPDDLIAGDPDALRASLGQAREVWGRMSRAQKVEDAIEASQNYLSGDFSGLRNQFAKLLRNPKASRGFSELEKTALRQAINGSPAEQLVNLAGGGLGQLASVTGGAVAGGIPGFMGGALAASLQRRLANSLTSNAAERALGAISSGALRDPALIRSLENAGQLTGRTSARGILGLIPGATEMTRSR